MRKLALIITWKAEREGVQGAAQAHLDAQREIAIEQQILKADRQGISRSEMAEIVEALINENQSAEGVMKDKTLRQGRNDMCACRSGKKYKYCCGEGR